jgi:pyridoxal phosphate enzyme (YggS family)
MINTQAYKQLLEDCKTNNITLITVSKTKPVEDILALYELGQKDFGENYVQELVEKQKKLPQDIRWHFIGHLQSNKVKQVVSFVHLIHGVDSLKLLKEIDKQGQKTGKILNCLLQVHIAREETKFGLDENELSHIITYCHELKNIQICGLMGMASFTSDMEKVRNEFKHLKSLQNRYAQPQTINCKLQTLSMGMTADYRVAIEEGSNMIRIGSLIFGERN